MFFSVQLRLGNECDFHGMLELARTLLFNLRVLRVKISQERVQCVDHDSADTEDLRGTIGLVVAQQAYRGVEVLRDLGTKMMLTREAYES